MSFLIEFRQEGPEASLGWEHRRSPEGDTDANLTTCYFFGQVLMSFDGATVVAPTWQLAAFFLMDHVMWAREELASSIASWVVMYFQESDHWLAFWRVAGGVRILFNYSGVVLTVPWDEFSAEVARFTRDLIHEFGRDHPGLLRHPLARKQLRDAGDVDVSM
ncbi:hypothetical protein [Homoserinibacter sp. GY 40078]|uniref:hypothetical protein n=1 Tax=Homoserinibacter sp. GY 40078 TaxID=2603275 RepID=UPI0011CACAE1|nr:hypothetical protein [Homoserinibacter sp. GY 40078]TXK17719.1 hypothetical protein FVQ89_13035 [Homoserinibacter sp. GY 40078]